MNFTRWKGVVPYSFGQTHTCVRIATRLGLDIISTILYILLLTGRPGKFLWKVDELALENGDVNHIRAATYSSILTKRMVYILIFWIYVSTDAMTTIYGAQPRLPSSKKNGFKHSKNVRWESHAKVIWCQNHAGGSLIRSCWLSSVIQGQAQENCELQPLKHVHYQLRGISICQLNHEKTWPHLPASSQISQHIHGASFIIPAGSLAQEDLYLPLPLLILWRVPSWWCWDSHHPVPWWFWEWFSQL